MSFFRLKKIKGKEYAYIVENEWHSKGRRQKVKDYIGRAYRFDTTKNDDFLAFMKIVDSEDYINQKDKKGIIKDLVKWELYKFGVDNQEFSIDLNNIKIQKKNKNAVLMINEGFMCELTLKNLLEFKAEGDEQLDGYRFARAFVEAGIKVPQEIFVGLYQKLKSF